MNQKTCSVEYGVCGQEQEYTTKGNHTSESSNRVILQLLQLPSGSSCYTYTITASDGTDTVIVKGMVDLPGKCNWFMHKVIIP